MEWHYNSIDGPRPGERCWYPKEDLLEHKPADLDYRTESEKKIESVFSSDANYAALADAISLEYASLADPLDKRMSWKEKALESRRATGAHPLEIAKNLAELGNMKESKHTEFDKQLEAFPSPERLESMKIAKQYAMGKTTFDAKSKRLMFETWNLLSAFYRQAKNENEAVAILQGKQKPTMADPKMKLNENMQKWVTICSGK